MKRKQSAEIGVTNQSGAVLILGLIMLLLMTIVALAAIRGTGLQETMAGNMRDRTIAFQAAEAGLRVGEQDVTDNWTSLNFSGGAAGYYPDLKQPGQTPVKDRPESFWTAENAVASGLELDMLPEDLEPMYTVERVEALLPAGSQGGAVDYENQMTYETVVFYRITSRSVGMTSNTEAVVQSTVRP